MADDTNSTFPSQSDAKAEKTAVVYKEDVPLLMEKRDGPVTLRLMDSPLWQSFRQEGTEMIITKAGRRMFPFVMVTFEGLSPTLLYSVYLSLIPCDCRQYKFCQRRWISVSDAPVPPTVDVTSSYLHPASPNRGTFWSQEMVSFAKLKITNNKHSQGDIVLQSMRKYMAQITVREDLGDIEYVFPLPETTFVAVTQYQNEAITRMKIAHNPFANGFKYAHVTGADVTKKSQRQDVTKYHDSRQKCCPLGSSKTSKTLKGKSAIASTAFTLPAQSCAPLEYPPPSRDLLTQESVEDSLFSSESEISISPLTHACPISNTATGLPFGIQPDHDVSLLRSFSSTDQQGQGRCFEQDEDENQCLFEDDCDRKNSFNEIDEPYATESNNTEVYDSKQGQDGDAAKPDETLELVHDATTNCSTLASLSQDSSKGQNRTQHATTHKNHLYSSFKLPLPKRKFSAKKLLGTKFDQRVTSRVKDVDMDWYRNALRLANLKEEKIVIKYDRGVRLTLHDACQWKEFRSRGSEMRLSPNGRSVSPTVAISLRGLDPGRLYSVWLSITEADDNFLDKLLQNAAWSPIYAMHMKQHRTMKPYMHPCSPMRGLAWMKEKIAFKDVKLTSDQSMDDPTIIPLHTGRRYICYVVVREEEETTPGSPESPGELICFPLKETTFFTTLHHSNEETENSVHKAEQFDPNTFRHNRKRSKDDDMEWRGDNSKELPENGSNSPAKICRVDSARSTWTLPGTASLIGAASGEATHHINPLHCLPALTPFPVLPPAHVGFLSNPNRVPFASSLPNLTPPFSFPSLFHQMRTPYHSGVFGIPPFSPLPYFYYPYSTAPINAFQPIPPEISKGLDLTIKADDTA